MKKKYLIAIFSLIVFSASLFLLTRFFRVNSLFARDGYFISGNAIDDVLLSSRKIGGSKNISLNSISSNDYFYQSIFGTLYVGEKKKVEVNSVYPIYTNSGMAIVNLDKDVKLINSRFSYYDGYPNFTLTGGKLYNYNDLEQADYEVYLFLQLSNGTYINLFPIEIKTITETRVIPVHSIISFGKDYCQYFSYDHKKLVYHILDGIDLSSSILMGNVEFSYEELLVGTLQKVAEDEDEEVPSDFVSSAKDSMDKKKDQEEFQDISSEDGWKWEKPSVSVTQFQPNVYSIGASLTVSDPANVIVSGVEFQVYVSDRVFLRRVFSRSSDIEINGLMPNTSYQVVGRYQYYDEEGVKKESTFSTQMIHTLDYSSLDAVTLSFQNGNIYSNQVEVRDLKISSSLKAEAVKGISSISVQINGTSYSLPSSLVAMIVSGKSVVYTTPSRISSNQQIHYEFSLKDAYGNSIPVKNASSLTRTSKKFPSVKFKILENQMNSVTVSATLSNEDKVGIENYRYLVSDRFGKIVQRSSLDKMRDVNEITLKNLDPNSLYRIQFFADFDSEDGNGVYSDSLIGEGTFTTMSLSTIGVLQISSSLREISNHSVILDLSLDLEHQSSLLLELLSSITVEIRDTSSQVVYTKKFGLDDLDHIRAGEVISCEISNLESMSEYHVSYFATVTQGSVTEDVQVRYDLDSFQTYKNDASILIKNRFVNEDMIDFDVSVVDLDSAIQSSRVLLEVRDALGKLVAMESISINGDYQRLSYEKLEKGATYTFTYKAEEYNIGFDNLTFVNDYVLFEEKIVTEEGISGSIELIHLLRQVKSNNLFNLADYNRIREVGSTGFKEYDLDNRSVTFGAASGYVNFSYFVPEVNGETVTVSFYAKYSSKTTNTANVYLSKGAFDSKDYLLEGLTKSDWKRFQFTFSANSDYIGFLIDEATSMTSRTYVSFKDIQIQKGKVSSTEYSSYQEEDSYLGTASISLQDKKDELSPKEYCVQVYRKGNLIHTYTYPFSSLVVSSELRDFTFLKNQNYELRLSVKIRDRYYDLSSVSFSTNTEIRSIRTVSDFIHMHPKGKYIVLNDLVFNSSSEYYEGTFYGDLDFLGHHIISNVSNRSSSLIDQIGLGGHVRNLVIDYHLDNRVARSYFYGFTRANYGTIDNFMIHVLSSNRQANTSFTLGVFTNYGTIKNFVVHSEAYVPARSVSGILVWSNQGTLQNGYLYGENMDTVHLGTSSRRKDVAPLAGETGANSRIENIFSLISVNHDSSLDSERSVGNLIGYSNGGILKNVYSVENKENTNTIDRDPNIGTVDRVNANHVYYASSKTYDTQYSTKISNLSLYDVHFQESVLNANQGFSVSSFVSLGYYPQLKLNDCMPSQDWIRLPVVGDADLIDVTSTREVSNDGDSAVVEFHLNNPASEKISKISIQDINTVEILSQVDERGKSVVTARLSNPIRYVSKYYIRSITSVSVMGNSYSTPFGQNERAIDISLYRLIHSISEFALINEIPNQNYMLKNDLDFSNATMSRYVISNFSGKLDGGGNTIKNIRISNQNGMFEQLTGTIQNLFIENYSKINSTNYGGFIYRSSDNALIDNVHMKKVAIKATNYLGGLIGYAISTTVKNSSVSEFENLTDANLLDVCIGGMIGYAVDSYLQNSYVSSIHIQIDDSQSTNGIGGMIGRSNGGGIDACYATGEIYSNSIYVGGIVGNLNSSVSRVWSNVSLSTELDYVGGISGIVSSNVSVSNTLVLGSIYSTFSGNYIHRTNGTPLLVVQNNFAWDKQQFFGYVTGDSSSELLLSTLQLQQEDTYLDMLNFGDDFSYSSISNQILPKLKNRDTGELLPGQVDSFFREEEFNVLSMEIDAQVTGATIAVELENPRNLNVTGITFDYLTVEKINRLSTQSGVTVIEVFVSPKRYYDSYTLSGIQYQDSSSNQQVYRKSVRVDLTFFKTLASYEDWQQVSKTTAENYRLAGDIDFSGKTNVNVGVSIGRLEGQGSGFALKNLTLNVDQAEFSLIQKITTSLSNVTFDHIEITSSASSGDYVNLIQYNYGVMSNIKFSSIKIHAPKVSYVAPVGYHRGTDVSHINISSNDIIGSSYVGGLFAYSNNSSSSQITADGCTVYGSNIYIGGVTGYKAYSTTANNSHYVATDMTVTGQGYVGGVFGYGSANQSAIYSSSVTAIAGRGYIGGFSGQAGQATTTSVEVFEGTILSHGSNYVGGAFGTAYDLLDVYVHDSSITQNGANFNYVGGVVGSQSRSYQRLGITSSTVTSAGSSTGGVIGLVQYNNLSYIYCYDVSVTGVLRVGGAVGYLEGNAQIHHALLNVKVIGSGDYVGGVAGSFSDSSMQPSISDIIVANSSISGNDYVGGLTGYINSSAVNSIQQILLVANVSSVLQSGHVGMITGMDKSLSDGYSFLSIYDKNKLNNQVISSISDYPNIVSDYFVDASMLMLESTYTDRGFSSNVWDYHPLVSNLYPKIKGNTGVLMSNQKDISLPVDTILHLMRNFSLVARELPKIDVYSSGIHTINLEFDRVADDCYFEVYQDGKKKVTQDILKRSYTLNYNYQSDLKIVVSDGLNQDSFTYTASDLALLVSTFDNHYAYLYQQKLCGNVDSVEGKFIHLYGDKALTSDLSVYDLRDDKRISKGNVFDVELLENSISLFKGRYEGVSIDTYYRYSVVHQKEGDYYFDKQLLIKDGNLEILDSSLSYRRFGFILDHFSNHSYVSILGDDGVIYHLKDEIILPKGFINRNIQYMSNNLDEDQSFVVVMYDTGRVVVFDYRTGKILEQKNAAFDISVIDYFKKNLSSPKRMFSSQLTKTYQKSLDLVEDLSKNPIQSSDDGTYSLVSDSFKKDHPDTVLELQNKDYVTYYNPVRESYDVLDIGSVISSRSDQSVPITENDKIYTSARLVDFYLSESIFEVVFGNDHAFIIFGLILIMIIVALILWIKNVKLLKIGEERKNE